MQFVEKPAVLVALGPALAALYPQLKAHHHVEDVEEIRLAAIDAVDATTLSQPREVSVFCLRKMQLIYQITRPVESRTDIVLPLLYETHLMLRQLAAVMPPGQLREDVLSLTVELARVGRVVGTLSTDSTDPLGLLP